MAKDISNLTNDERTHEVHDLIEAPSQQNASEPAGLAEARDSAYAAPQKNGNDSQSTEQNNHSGTETRRYQSGYARNNESMPGAGSGSILPQLKIEGKGENDSIQSTSDLGAPQHELRISSVSQIRQRTDGSVDDNFSIGSTLSKLIEHRRSESSPESGSLGELYVQAGLKLAESPSIKDRVNGAVTAPINSRFLSADMPVLQQIKEARFQITAPLETSPSQENKKAPSDSRSPLDSSEPGKPESFVQKLPSILPIRDGGSSNSSIHSGTDKGPANRVPADKAPSPTDGDSKSPTKPGISSFISNIIGAACTTGCGENNDKPQKPTRDVASPGQGILGGIMSVIGNQKKPPSSGSPDRAPAPSPREGALDRQTQQPVLNSIGQIIGTQKIRPEERRGSGDNIIGHAISNYVNNQNNPEQRRPAPVADSSVGGLLSNIINSGSRTATDALPAVLPTVRDQRTQASIGEQLQNSIANRTNSDNTESPKPAFKDSILPILQDLFNNKDRAPEQVNPTDKQGVILEPRHEQRVVEQESANERNAIDRGAYNTAPATFENTSRAQVERFVQHDNRAQTEVRMPILPAESKAAKNLTENVALTSHIVSAGASFNRATMDAVHIAPKQIHADKGTQAEIAGPIKLVDLKSTPAAERIAGDISKHGDILKHAGIPGVHKAQPENEHAIALKVPQTESGMPQLRDRQNRRSEPSAEQKGKGLREPLANLHNAENRLLGPGGKQFDQNPLAVQITESDKNGQNGNKSGSGHKDVNEKKEDSFTEKATVLIAGRKAQREDKPTGDIKRQPEKKNSSEPQVRRRYAVRPGDTLQSIAKIHLFDERFALLLEMINRANLHYKFEGSLRKVTLRVGQNIWLPTASEMKVHRSLFFTEKNSKQFSSDPETSLLNTPTQVQNVLVELNSAQRFEQNTEQKRTPYSEVNSEEKFEHHSTFLTDLADLPKPKVIRKVTRKVQAQTAKQASTVAPLECSENEGKNLFSVLNVIRHTGKRESSSLPELTIFSSNEHKTIVAGVEDPVRVENKGMEANNNTFDMLSQIFEQQNNNAIQKSSAESSNIADVLKRLRESAAANKRNSADFGNFAAEQQVDTLVDLVQHNKDIEQLLVQLSETVRVTSKEETRDRASFVIALQTKLQNQWITVASYESKRGQTARFLFRQNGGRQEFTLQLPQFVVRNMALQDFTRNYQNYISEFLGESSQRRNSTSGY